MDQWAVIEPNNINGSFTKIIPPIKATELSLNRMRYLMRHDLPSEGCSFEAVSTDVIVPISGNLDLTQANELACKIASSKLDHELEAEIPACINIMLDDGEITFISAESLEVESPYSDPVFVSSWSDKTHHLQQGSEELFTDLNELHEQLRAQMKESCCYHGNKLTLIVPTSHVPFLMAKTGSCDSALAMLKAALPNLELLTVPALKCQQKTCALLICTSEAYGPAGYLSLDGDISFRPDAQGKKYKVTIPKHQLVINHPEQIAVLTGI